MRNGHQGLERQVQRIHQLLEAAGATVKWNERIPDPDNPEQLRQIDVSIRRGNTFTMVECRDHKNPQDVKWIEEIIGRRISLRADSVIAVSSSGFTKGAVAKAINNGVVLRDFATLTDSEISEWGRNSDFTLIFYEFRDVKLYIEVQGQPSGSPVFTDESGRPFDFGILLRDIVNKAEAKITDDNFKIFKAKVMAKLFVDRLRSRSISIEGRLRSRKKKFHQPVIKKYIDATNNNKHATVENFPVGETQIIRGPETCSLVFDLSQIRIPDRCIFGFPVFHDENGIAVNSAEIIGTTNILKFRINIEIQIASF